MDQKLISNALKDVRSSSKRNFVQSVDLIINLKGLNLKDPAHQVDQYIQMHYPRGKPVKLCAFVGPELADQSREVMDATISVDDFPQYSDKKQLKKLAKQYDFFVAQATVMPKVASVFGKVLGPRGKMPNPRAGCVVPPNANLKPLAARLRTTARAAARTAPTVQVAVGREDMKDEELAENAFAVYNGVLHALPQEKNNISAVYLKLTMGKPVKVEEKKEK
ncbi:MAG TPA: 50S ribosomal protein L1 [Candidatus Nanoarchaeia archaeon]|nr:50S ribosomal protein L1 [Candidatus Nanoarchaeia archaeon]